ncbi:MAG TPA: hypothetical protein VKG01_10675 [Thermoanaerobaculia bacterium]|nr:hypothetical protein [Thermoanaerobaculia bacterium]
MRIGLAGCLAVALALNAETGRRAEGGFLYRATLMQAAPGKLLELIDLYKAERTASIARGEEGFFWMRHSQGDHWDLLVLFPMGSYGAYYARDRIEARQRSAAASPDSARRIRDAISRREDVFVWGPPLAETQARFEKSSFFHVEMFQSLPARQDELVKEREMENAYLKALGRPVNLLFVRDAGADWDVFTIGFYRDLKHYAESADIPETAQEAAAKAAGFEDAKHIGPYLRSLISSHHDTLAIAVR